jgi:ribosomal protein S18 acetylase RimI-like enzyme
MSARLHLAGSGDLDRLLPLVTAQLAASGVVRSEAHNRAALLPLLDGSPHGAIWLIGPKSAPVGMIAVSFGWSIQSGGLDGTIDAFFIRESIRGRGMGTEALRSLISELSGSGLTAIHVSVGPHNAAALRIFHRLRFEGADDTCRMTWSDPSA